MKERGKIMDIELMDFEKLDDLYSEEADDFDDLGPLDKYYDQYYDSYYEEKQQTEKYL